MRLARLTAIVVLCGIPLGLLQAQMERPGVPPPPPFRWTGSADWEYYSSDSDSQGVDSTLDSFRQKYSLGASGFVWNPRFNRYSLGLDFFVTDRERDGEELDSDSFGYRFLTTFFPTRPFPLNVYARRSTTDTSGGIALANSDRETGAWGAEWNIVTRNSRRLRLLFDRNTYEVLDPVTLLERRKTGVLDFDGKFGRSDLSFRYGLHDQKELVGNTDFNRDNFTFTDRTKFDNDSTLVVNAHYTQSDALFTTGVQDHLNTSRLMSRYDLPRGDRVRLGFSYDFNDNDGKFVNSTSHTGRADGRFKMNSHWESTGSLIAGRIDSASTSSDLEQDLHGARAGVRYIRDWTRLHLTTSYSVGYSKTKINIGEDRRIVSQFAEVSNHIPLNHNDEVFVTLSRVLDDNDTTGVGFTYDENRITAGWEGRFGSAWRGRVAAIYRDSTRDTFQFGDQDSEEISIEGSLNHPLGGISLTLASREGVSDFLPDPSSGSPFLPGTDLVSEADIVSLGTHWRLWRTLRFHFQGRMENRDFTTIGKEDILSYHPRIDYDFHAWGLSVSFSHYERRNTTEFTDDTWLVRVTRRFF